jgi:hypothetical protein
MFKRLLEILAVIWGATSVAVESEIQESKERAKQSPSNPDNPSRKAGHELSDLSSKLLLSLAISMIVLSVVMHLGLAGSLFYLKKKLTRTEPQLVDASLVTGREMPPAPRLQRNPPADYIRYHSNQDRILKSYGWMDRNAGIVRIPIDRAMEILSHGK